MYQCVYDDDDNDDDDVDEKGWPLLHSQAVIQWEEANLKCVYNYTTNTMFTDVTRTMIQYSSPIHIILTTGPYAILVMP